MSYKTHAYGDRESHSGIVPTKWSKAGRGDGKVRTASIGDERLVRLILKWMKAGVMEDGQWFETKEGTPQGW